MGTLVEMLACIRGHHLLPFMAAAWAGQHGLQNNRAHSLATSFEVSNMPSRGKEPEVNGRMMIFLWYGVKYP
jgi:hypothetical protein